MYGISTREEIRIYTFNIFTFLLFFKNQIFRYGRKLTITFYTIHMFDHLILNYSIHRLIKYTLCNY